MSSVKASPFDWRKKDSIFLADRHFTLEAAISNISKAKNAAQPPQYTNIRNDMTTFVHTRSRNGDSDTSKEAAKNAATSKSNQERIDIGKAVMGKPMTALEIAEATGIDYYTIQRRISECGLFKTNVRRDKRVVWSAVTQG